MVCKFGSEDSGTVSAVATDPITSYSAGCTTTGTLPGATVINFAADTPTDQVHENGNVLWTLTLGGEGKDTSTDLQSTERRHLRRWRTTGG